MKFVFAFLAIYLLATATAIKSSAAASEAATREAVASLRRLTSTKLGKTLIDTLQIELKSSAGVDPRPRILNLLQEIQQDTNDQISGYNDRIAVVRQECSSTQASLNDQISNLEADVASATDLQAATTDELNQASSQLTATSELRQSLQGQLSDATQARDSAKEAYILENQKLQQTRSILEQARGFITDRLDQLSGSSFLQKNNILVEVKRRVMSPEFQIASPGWGKLINFLATKALEKLRLSQGDDGAAGLEKVVTVINDILDHINKSINDQNAAEIAAQAAYDVISSGLNDQISSSDAQISGLELSISNAQSMLDGLSARLAGDNNSLEQAEQELDDKVAYCKQSEDQYNEDFSRSNEEAEIIQEVINIVQNQLTNLVSAVESAAASSA